MALPIKNSSFKMAGSFILGIQQTHSDVKKRSFALLFDAGGLGR